MIRALLAAMRPSVRTSRLPLRRAVVPVLALGFVPLVSSSCTEAPFGTVRGGQRLVVEFVEPSDPDVGTRLAGLPLPVRTAPTFNIKVSAVRTDGSIDTSFNRYVRISSKPGAVEPLTGDGADGRNVLLRNGQSATVAVKLASVFGVTYILAGDIGYVPVDPLRKPAPACANGIDDDGDGAIDYPADDGCAFANDDAEEGGTYAEGASPPIFFSLPRIKDARGLDCSDPTKCIGSGATPYAKQAIKLDTGYHEFLEDDGTHGFRFDFSTVVTRISSSGFFVADLSEDGPERLENGFNNLYTFNFSAPPDMKVCDRLKTFAGTPSEFYGFTQMGYPTWTLEEWDPSERRCLVPEPTLLMPDDVTDRTKLLRLSGGLVRVETLVVDGQPIRSAMVTPNFGRADMLCNVDGTPTAFATLKDGIKGCDTRGTDQTIAFVTSPDATNCDFNGNGSVDFRDPSCVACTGAQADLPSCDPGGCFFPEDDCAQTCTTDPECTEYSNFSGRSTFRLTLALLNGQKFAIQADGTAANFDPFANKGKQVRSFAGTLTYFSGGAQYTIEARCADDIVMDLDGTPLGADNRTDLSQPPPRLACVLPRTLSDDSPQ